jgi:hypothetical protein
LTGTLPGLAVATQRWIEALYALEAQAPVADFLIPAESAGRFPGGGSRTLVTCEGDEVSLGVVLEPRVVESLDEHDPRRALTRDNLAAYCTLTEEVSHFVYLGYCARHARVTTQLELELVGEVDKYLAAADLLSLQREGALSPQLRRLLFRGYSLAEGLSMEQADRYHRASGLAERYCAWLESAFVRPGRPAELHREARRFYRLGRNDKLARIASLQ